jgi:hypothetical protein
VFWLRIYYKKQYIKVNFEQTMIILKTNIALTIQTN